MMNLEIDFRSGVPIYLQVVEQIRARIASGQIQPGDQLPTVRALALDLRVNFNTIARSYHILDESGIISTQRGRGTYVISPPAPEVSAEIRSKALAALTYRYLADAHRLGMTPRDVQQMVEKQVTFWQQNGSLMENEMDE